MSSIGKTLVATLLVLLTSGAGAAQPAAAAERVIQKAAATAKGPGFRVKTLDGKTVSSEQLAGRPYIVNFFASWCPPCRKELPDMVQLQKKYEKQGFTFIGFAVRDNEAALPDFLWELGIDFPVAMADPALSAEFGRYLPGGLRGIPATFVIGRDGRVIRAFSGALSKADFEELVLQAIRTK